jgi:hypothetical protein
MLKQYLTCLYYSVIILGVGEIGPVNPLEYVVGSISLFLSLVINAFVFSDLVV